MIYLYYDFRMSEDDVTERFQDVLDLDSPMEEGEVVDSDLGLDHLFPETPEIDHAPPVQIDVQ